ncbi:DUF6497 family protein [Amylibacter sp. IMCC11727]|uniref:DUF6497 family protein n=1 Tax=Amylibacter sp. IMCC11727 TaxID=3039851 RepID=UPI00244E5851|nr:DUF6497 family protein [Amylibacter sp. IMCC11727]WGI20620.1 DUF6497 family protein [Amylibacter sp. IMCC11727]
MTAVLDHMVGAGGWLWRGVALSVAVAVSALPAHAYDLTVPSGQIVTLDEQLVVPPDNRILYLGFTAPSIGGDYAVTFDRASQDMDQLCEAVGIPEAGRLIGEGLRIDEVVIRLMERLIPYGEVDPDAAQFLNAYDISGGNCVWM